MYLGEIFMKPRRIIRDWIKVDQKALIIVIILGIIIGIAAFRFGVWVGRVTAPTPG